MDSNKQKGMTDNTNNLISAGDIKYILRIAELLKIGFQGDNFLHNIYLIEKNGIYLAHVENGRPFYSSLSRTDFGYELTNHSALFTEDKVDVYLVQNDQRTLLQSYEVKIENQFGEVRISDGTYIIKSLLTNKALDLVTDSSVGELSNVHLWSYNNQLSAEWNFKYEKEKKAYTIGNSKNPDLVMAWNDFRGGWNVLGTPFEPNKDEHYWKVKRTSLGFTNLVNLKKRNGEEVVLSVDIGNSDGTNIMVYKRNETILDQEFKLIAR